MAVQIGSCPSFSWASSSASHNNSKLARSQLCFGNSQRDVISQIGNTKGLNFAKDLLTGFRYNCGGSLNFNNSKRGFHKNKLPISFATSEEKNPSTNPNKTTLLEDSSFDLGAQRTQGKPGFISFHGYSTYKRSENINGSGSNSEPAKEKRPDLVWLVGPTVLVSFLVLPSVYMRKILSLLLEDSLLTDFLILFFTEALFYAGILIFILLTDHAYKRHSKNQVSSLNPGYLRKAPRYLRILSVTTKVLNLIIPLVTMGLVWPWTGPATSATLGPYLVGLVVQFAFEQYARRKKSPSWLIIPVIFQVYRLHQLNRAAQLVTALTFSLRSAELTSQTLAITKSLGALLIILQALGVICIWSLSSFLMRFFPCAPKSSET